MTQETKHTPTPWEFVVGIDYGYIHHAKGEIFSDGAEMSKEDAAFIVRAVNAHDELVKALEEIRDRCPKDDDDYYIGFAYEYRIIAEAAIAKARGETT